MKVGALVPPPSRCKKKKKVHGVFACVLRPAQTVASPHPADLPGLLHAEPGAVHDQVL